MPKSASRSRNVLCCLDMPVLDTRDCRCMTCHDISYKGKLLTMSARDAGKKTIEGSLFNSLVATGLVSKANANDPKKSALSRCARTDKGVHAAGNLISIKLTTLEDYDEPITKLNANLGSQAIRVWGIQRTTGSFSSYQACDSRWYEYLIPTHVFLPPHSNSHLAKRLREGAEEVGDLEAFEARQEEVKDYWAHAKAKYIRPILDELSHHISTKALEKIRQGVDQEAPAKDSASDQALSAEDRDTLTIAVKRLKSAYAAARRDWRISPARLARIQPTLDRFLGTSPSLSPLSPYSSTDMVCASHLKKMTRFRPQMPHQKKRLPSLLIEPQNGFRSRSTASPS